MYDTQQIITALGSRHSLTVATIGRTTRRPEILIHGDLPNFDYLSLVNHYWSDMMEWLGLPNPGKLVKFDMDTFTERHILSYFRNSIAHPPLH